jgi:hypothetical protein
LKNVSAGKNDALRSEIGRSARLAGHIRRNLPSSQETKAAKQMGIHIFMTVRVKHTGPGGKGHAARWQRRGMLFLLPML